MAESESTTGNGDDEKDSPMPPGADLAAFLINSNKIVDAFQGAMARSEAGITLTDWLMLRSLRGEGPLHPSKVAARVGITRQRVHQQMGPLRNAGLIAVVESDEKRNLLTLTQAGDELVQRYEDSFLALLSSDARLTAEAMLRKARASTYRIMRVLRKVSKAGRDEE